MQKLVCLVCLATPSLALAEERDVANYIEVNASLGLSHPFIGIIMGAASGGHRISDAWWLHGELSSGFGADDEGSGYIGQARFGAEARPCTSGGLACFVSGLDLGIEYATYNEEPDPAYAGPNHYTLAALVAVPRVGLDIGGKHLRFRAAFELAFGLIERHH